MISPFIPGRIGIYVGVDKKNANRRDVLLAVGAGILGGSMSNVSAAPSKDFYRSLGHTGEKVSCIGLGGFHLGKAGDESESDALKLIHASIDRGINFLDNSWDYNEGESEKRMGKAVKASHLRSRFVFMMTKNDGAHGGGVRQAA